MKKTFFVSLILIICFCSGIFFYNNFKRHNEAIISKTFGGSNDDFAHGLIKTKDGGFLLFGDTTSDDGDVTGNHGDNDAWVVKLDSKFNLEWQKTFGGSLSDEARAVIETKDGNFAMVGSTQSKNGDVAQNHGGYDYWFVKFNKNGNILWQKCFGGSSDDNAFDLIQVKGGGYLIVGSSYSENGDVKGAFIGKDIWLIRIDETGNLIWQRKLGGVDNEAYKIIQTRDSGFLIVGSTPGANSVLSDDGASEHDVLVVKFSSRGVIEWLKTLGGSNEEAATTVIETSNKNYMIAGWTRSHNGDVKGNHGESDFWVIKMNSHGSVLWTKCYGGSKSDEALCMVEGNNHQYIIAGSTKSNDGNVKGNHGETNTWVIKINDAGKLLGQRCFGGNHDDIPANIVKTKFGDYVLAGWTSSDKGQIKASKGKSDFWVLKFRD